MYGCIDETEFSLSSPRAIDGDECETIEKAFGYALELLKEGAEKVSVGPVKFYGEDGNGFWGEIVGEGQISIESNDVAWIKED